VSKETIERIFRPPRIPGGEMDGGGTIGGNMSGAEMTMADGTVTEDLTYFQKVRREIEPLLPAAPARILEIGCGAGATLAWLKQRWPQAETFGVEGHRPLEPLLRTRLDNVLIHDLEQPLPDLGRFDLILALDVLEHLRDPWAVLATLRQTVLAPGGVVIVSVPNVAHYSVTVPLAFGGRFTYAEDGLLDRTHLRFFDEDGARGLMAAAGLTVTDGVATGFAGLRQTLAQKLSFGLLQRYITMQFVMRGEAGGQPMRRWRIF
jgi:2-polyprenyl-3-methyl-5-hydroxy-6-metoxy-1,4-benzoquinol methylase